jgi:hypothetical protein
LLRSVIDAVVQVPVAARTPPWDVVLGFSGWSTEAVQFLKGIQADNTTACWGSDKAFYETSVREPMAALLDQLSREFRRGTDRPSVPGRFWAGKSPHEAATCSASCGRADGRLDVHHRRPVDCLQSVDFNPKPVARHDAGTVPGRSEAGAAIGSALIVIFWMVVNVILGVSCRTRWSGRAERRSHSAARAGSRPGSRGVRVFS